MTEYVVSTGKCRSIKNDRVKSARVEIMAPISRVGKCRSESINTRLQGWRM